MHSSIDFQIKSVKLNIISVGYPNKDERRKMSFITQSKTVLTRLIDTAFIRFFSTQTQCLFWGGAFMYVGVVFQSFNLFEKNKKEDTHMKTETRSSAIFCFVLLGKMGSRFVRFCCIFTHFQYHCPICDLNIGAT